MNDWQPIETAPKEGVKFLATNGILLGVGSHTRIVEDDTLLCTAKWKAFYDDVRAPFEVPFTKNGTFPHGFDYLENRRAADEAWDKVKENAPPFERIPNPRAGQVQEWYQALAFHAFDGKSATCDYEGPISFTPTHWMPMPVSLSAP